MGRSAEKGKYQIEGRKKSSLLPALPNHLLLSELALSLLFGLIQVKISPLADKWTEAFYIHFLTHYKTPCLVSHHCDCYLSDTRRPYEQFQASWG